MNKEKSWDKRDWMFLALLAAITLIAWSTVLFRRDSSLGIEVDFLRQFYPARYFGVTSLKGGTFPLWAPYALSGFPYFASYQTAVLYPPNLLMLALYAVSGANFSLRALIAYQVFHVFLAGVFTYLLCKELKLERWAAMVGAVAYMFCGYLVAHAGHISQQNAATWIPLIFFFFYRAMTKRSPGNTVCAGVTLGVALLAGHFQPLFYLGVLLFLFVIYVAVVKRHGEPDYPGFWYGLGSLALVGVIGVALASVQLIPTLELIGLSARRKMPFASASAYYLPPKQAINLLFPRFFGAGGPGSPNYFGGWVFWETYGYVGITTIGLSLVGLRRRGSKFPWFLASVAVLSLILALGPKGLLYTLLYKIGLGFNMIRDPSRILIIFGFCLALLGAYGANHLIKTLKQPEDMRKEQVQTIKKKLIFFLIFVLVVILASSIYLIAKGPAHSAHTKVSLRSFILPTAFLLGLILIFWVCFNYRKLGRALAPLLVLLVAVDVILLSVPAVTVKINPDDPFGDRQAGTYLAGLPFVFRVETDANTMYKTLDDGSIYAIQKSTGDDSLVLEDFYRYRELITPSVAPGVQLGLFYDQGLKSPLLDLLNDWYFISREKINPALNSGKFEYLGEKGDVHVYRNREVMPRAWLAPKVVEVPDKEAALEKLREDPARVREEAMVVAPPGTVPKSSITEPGGVEVKEYSEHHIVLRVPQEAKGLLVLSEVMYPGWEVLVDGKKKEILRTDFLFRGVVLEGGQKEVIFRYRPFSLKLGMIISLVTIGLLFLYLLYWLVGKRVKMMGKRSGEEVPID